MPAYYDVSDMLRQLLTLNCPGHSEFDRVEPHCLFAATRRSYEELRRGGMPDFECPEGARVGLSWWWGGEWLLLLGALLWRQRLLSVLRRTAGRRSLEEGFVLFAALDQADAAWLDLVEAMETAARELQIRRERRAFRRERIMEDQRLYDESGSTSRMDRPPAL